jgi:hypothetical protein
VLPPPGGGSTTNLADLLERVLDKGVVIAGDVRVNLLDIELLTIRIRLLVASVDRAREMGLDWWEHDPALSSGARDRALADENARLRERLAELEAARGAVPADGGTADDRADDREPVAEPAGKRGDDDERDGR